MHKFLFLTLFTFLFSQAEITNIQVSQRTDGSQIVDITYDLLEDDLFQFFEITVLISIDGNDDFVPIEFAYGDILSGITSGVNKSIIWNFGDQFNETFTNQADIRIDANSTAILEGDNGELPFEMLSILEGEFTFGEDNINENIDYDFEIMKYNVTDYDYVVFLTDVVLSNEEYVCTDLTNSDGSPWCELGGIEDEDEWTDFNCEWYESVGCPDLGDEYNNDLGYSALEACCSCGGGNTTVIYPSIREDGVYANYSGDGVYPADDYLILKFDDSKISYDGQVFVVEEGYVNHPVTGVTWFGAWYFATYYGLQLPNELEWEKAARANSGYEYPWGNYISELNANYSSSTIFSNSNLLSNEWQEFYVNVEIDVPLINNTTPVGMFNGINEIQSYDLTLLNTVDFMLVGSPFTINQDCSDLQFGLWDTWGDHNVYYEIRSLENSEIIFSDQSLNVGNQPDGNCGWEESPCDYWMDMELKCLPAGNYFFDFYSLNYPQFTGDIFGYIFEPGFDVSNEGTSYQTENSSSQYGLYDMAGNVSQWLNKGSFDLSSITKGGSWSSSEDEVKSWKSLEFDATYSKNNLGFRCSRRIFNNSRSEKDELIKKHKILHNENNSKNRIFKKP